MTHHRNHRNHRNHRDRLTDGKLTSRLTVVALLAAVLILPPLLTAATRAGHIGGLPAVWVYLFAAWAAVIITVGLVVHRSE
jgi:hypothetical protein